MRVFVTLLSLLVIALQISSDQAQFLHNSSPKDSISTSRRPRSLLLSPNNEAIYDIAVPEEQRLYGRQPHGDLEKRPPGLESRSLQTYLDSYKQRTSEETGIVEESSVNDDAVSNFSLPSFDQHPSPAPARRDVKVDPRCQFDAEKWALHMDSSLSYAVMFDRKTGGSCTECLESCMRKQSGAWTCRSVIYDNNWRICDMFAIVGTIAPFTLVEYEDRDYYEYLAATPPSDNEITHANNFSLQEQANFEKKVEQGCGADVHEKATVLKTESVPHSTYDAKPIQEKLEAEEEKARRTEKERRKKTSKLQKVVKDDVLETIFPPLTDVQEPVSEEITLELTTFATKSQEISSPARKEILQEVSDETHSSSKREERTHKVETSIAGRNKSSKKSKEKKAISQEIVNYNVEKSEKAIGVTDGKDSQEVSKKHRKVRKLRKGIRRTQPKIKTTEVEMPITTETSGKLSTDMTRTKIEMYQQRKASETTKSFPNFSRRRVRLHEGQLHGDPLDEEDLHRQESRRHPKIENYSLASNREHDNKKSELQLTVRRKAQKKAEKQTKGKSKSKNRRTKTIETTTSMTASTRRSVSTTVAVANMEYQHDELRMALKKKIRKFASKDLKEKDFRAHGTSSHQAEEAEQLDLPNIISMADRPNRSHDRSPQTLDFFKVCEENDQVVMMIFPASTRKPYSLGVQKVRVNDHRQCIEECELNTDCSSAVFSDFICEMSTTRARHTIPDIRPAVNQTYIEKACINKSLVKGRSTHLSGVANYILAGFVEQVENAYGIEQCVSACYAALKRYGFQCMSAMWYPMDKEQNCLLNSQTRRTQPKLFVPEDSGSMMVYFEHPDALFMKRHRDDAPSGEMSKSDKQWTSWSTCHGHKDRTRYQKCSEYRDVRKCPKESSPCKYKQLKNCKNDQCRKQLNLDITNSQKFEAQSESDLRQ